MLVGVRRGWMRRRVVGKGLTRPHGPAREIQSPVVKVRVSARGRFYGSDALGNVGDLL